jgi:cell division protein FtsQ
MSKAPARRRRILPRAWIRPIALGGAAVLAAGGLAGGIWWKADALRQGALAATAEAGFAVREVRVEGRQRTSREAILRAVKAERGTPILAVSPVEARTRLESLAWVRSASVERLLPDTLHIRLVEREPFALWQRQGKLHLIDRDGAVITSERLERFPGLLVVVGEDAPRHAAGLVEMLAREPDLEKRVTAAVRVGGRRWNLRFDNGIDVQLPENDAATAWAQLAKVERTTRVLARDVEVIDLRLPDRLVVRTAPEPAKAPAKKGKNST